MGVDGGTEWHRVRHKAEGTGGRQRRFENDGQWPPRRVRTASPIHDPKYWVPPVRACERKGDRGSRVLQPCARYLLAKILASAAWRARIEPIQKQQGRTFFCSTTSSMIRGTGAAPLKSACFSEEAA